MDEKNIFALEKHKMLEILVQRYQKPLYGYLMRFTNDAFLTDEIVQDTFVKVYQKSHLYSKDKPFKPWIYKIAINVAKDKLRQKKRYAQLTESEEPVTKILDSPEQHLQQKELGEQIQNAIGKLPEVQREVFILRQYEKMSYLEISTTIDRPINTVKSDMRRALHLLRELLDSLSDNAMKGKNE